MYDYDYDYDYGYGYGYDYDFDYFFNALGVIGVLFIALLMGLGVLFMAARYVSISTLFTKAGDAPWKSLIPVYDMYTFFKLTWKVKMFIPYVCGLAAAVIGSLAITILSASYHFYYSIGLVLFFALIMFAGMILWFVFQIMLYHRISKAFGQGAGYTVGLVFLEVIFLMILAFGKSKYLGAEPVREPNPNAGYYYRQENAEPNPAWNMGANKNT
ncbi:MAG: DUF5684 domain-containing protein, partial [Bacillota bacterium]|nr:DUF5684 domain-containing protein [Bacillota bacterium]